MTSHVAKLREVLALPANYKTKPRLKFKFLFIEGPCNEMYIIWDRSMNYTIFQWYFFHTSWYIKKWLLYGNSEKCGKFKENVLYGFRHNFFFFFYKIRVHWYHLCSYLYSKFLLCDLKEVVLIRKFHPSCPPSPDRIMCW